ncbi:hypothetical protein N7520_004086 [Penicillium odoratum]|uniref:uncharacterized protein n=1 Tax=Penicillium odoratum TaxID=1167516 RepID=UPI0025476450|nr:uncharacterized protein N7520_004086 [Penicillium odoratum]KAJ5769527.1 hypothetical protein N7520_004086 [Penicillium odoratum]
MADTQTPSEQTPLIEPTSKDESPANLSAARGLLIAVLMAFLIFIQATNISMMTTAQSQIAADLDAFAEATWFTSAFMIAASSVTPLAGRFSAIFTPRYCLVVSSMILSLGLFITAAAPSLAIFLLGRAVTGLGSGGLMSISVILVLAFSSAKRRGLFIGLISTNYTVGLSSGAVLAGLLTPIMGWRLIFWIQAPIALVMGPLLFLAIPPPSDDNNSLVKRNSLRSLARIDYAGALTLTISVVLLLTTLASPEVLIWPIPLSLLFFAIFLLVESRWTQEPIIPVHLFLDRGVLLSCLSGVALMMARWCVLFFTPVYAIAVRGWAPASAGLILVPTNAGFGAGGILVGWLHIRKGGSYYASCLILYVLFSLATVALSVLSTDHSSPVLYMTATFFNGLFAGALMNYTLSHLLHLTSPHMHYIVSALFTTFRGLAGSFGSAAGGGFFTRMLKATLIRGFEQHGLPPKPDLVRTLLGSPATVSHLEGLERLIAVQSYEHAFRMLFLAATVIALVATVLQAGAGRKAGSEDKTNEWEERLLIECDPSIKSMILRYDEERHDYIVEDLDDENHLVIKESQLENLKARLDHDLDEKILQLDESDSE